MKITSKMSEFIIQNQKFQLYNEIANFVSESRLENGDVIVRCCDGDVYGHSVVLALYSSLFRYASFNSDEDIVIFALDFSTKSFGYLLSLLYLGKIEVIEEETRVIGELCDLLGKIFIAIELF